MYFVVTYAVLLHSVGVTLQFKVYVLMLNQLDAFLHVQTLFDAFCCTKHDLFLSGNRKSNQFEFHYHLLNS